MNRSHPVKLLALPAALATLVAVMGASNIDNSAPNKYAWSENGGWTNWRDANGSASGAVVGLRFMSGFVWGENLGWIKLGNGSPTNGLNYSNTTGADSGVNIAADGTLTGYAWGENVGWINFGGGAMATPPNPARIRCATPPSVPLARLIGFAWGENVGWINLNDALKFVSVDALTTPLACDVNHDGLKNGRDVQFFVNFLLYDNASWRDICSGDVQAVPNNAINVADIPPFINCLLTGP